MDFLAGNQTYECTPWSMPLLTVFGWQKPCYLLGEGYAKSFTELMEGTEWEKYGVGKYEKCANCMVHCGFEGTAATDAIKHPLKMLPILLRGVKTEGPMAPEIDLSRQRPAEFVFSRPRREEDVRDPAPAIPDTPESRQRSSCRTPCWRPVPVRISAGNCPGLRSKRPQHPPMAMPPSGFIAASAAGGSTWPASSEMTRSTASGRPRDAAKRAATWLSMSTARAPVGLMQTAGLGLGLFDDHVAAKQRALMGMAAAAMPGARASLHGRSHFSVPVTT